MEGIYKLSSMAAERSKDEKNARGLEGELHVLRAELSEKRKSLFMI